jgi:hypothetical protein
MCCSCKQLFLVSIKKMLQSRRPGWLVRKWTTLVLPKMGINLERSAPELHSTLEKSILPRAKTRPCSPFIRLLSLHQAHNSRLVVRHTLPTRASITLVNKTPSQHTLPRRYVVAVRKTQQLILLKVVILQNRTCWIDKIIDGNQEDTWAERMMWREGVGRNRRIWPELGFLVIA